VNQPARGRLGEGRRIDGVDKAAGDDIEDLIKEPSALLGLVLLEYETSGHHWNQQEAEEHRFSGSRHTGYEIGEGVNLIRYAHEEAEFQE
jgi:hypothetical protein